MVSDFCQISNEISNFAEAVGKFASAQRLDAEVSLFKGNEGDMWPERFSSVSIFLLEPYLPYRKGDRSCVAGKTEVYPFLTYTPIAPTTKPHPS